MQIVEIDCTTGEVIERAMTEAEQAAHDAEQAAEATARAAEQAALDAAEAQRTADTATLHDALTTMGLPDAAAALLRILNPPAA